MTTLPNWVDLVIVTVILRACYNGFGRGIVAELLSLVAAVSVTAVTLNYWSTVADTFQTLPVDSHLLAVVGFWGLFFILLIAARIVLGALMHFLKWERLHWTIQGVGMIVGGVRGLWWSGFLLVVLTSSGIVVLQRGVEEGSMLGPRLLQLSRTNLERIADAFPGGQHRTGVLIPSLNPKSTP